MTFFEPNEDTLYLLFWYLYYKILWKFHVDILLINVSRRHDSSKWGEVIDLLPANELRSPSRFKISKNRLLYFAGIITKVVNKYLQIFLQTRLATCQKMSAKFLGADDYRLDPSHNPPYTKYDDVEANEKQEFRFMNIY